METQWLRWSVLAAALVVAPLSLGEAQAVCGDGIVDAGEDCDDGNTRACDGCGSACDLEKGEPGPESNDAPGEANGLARPGVCREGTISPASDVDVYRVRIDVPTSLRIETFDGTGQGCVQTDTFLRLLAPDGVTGLAQDNNGGIGLCSRINAIVDVGAQNLAPGDYFVEVSGLEGQYSLLIVRTELDRVCAGQAPTLVGTVNDDLLVGGAGDDVIKGLGGNDLIRGKQGDDVICAAAGNDTLRGGLGNDLLRGGFGDDNLKDVKGINALNGGAGTDVCVGADGNTIVKCENVTPTPTNTPGGPTPTPTNTPGGPTATPTNTPGGPTATPTPTNTPGGPTATPTPTSTPTPTGTIGVAGTVKINEVVAEPRTDWEGSTPPFTGPGTGNANNQQSDEWIELFNAGASAVNLTGWQVVYTDNNGTETCTFTASALSCVDETNTPLGNANALVFSGGSTISNFLPGTFLVIGDVPGSMSADVYVQLRNSGATQVDDVEIGDDPEADGAGDGAPAAGDDAASTNTTNESIFRSPNGVDTDNDIANFNKGAATIGSANP